MRLNCTHLLGFFGLMLSFTAHSQLALDDHMVLYSTNGISAIEDTNRLFVIHEITISGNNKTRPEIILRELSFDLNEEYPFSAIADKFTKARRQLLNTGLFHEVTVSLKSLDDHDVYVNVDVKEKWYIWPRVFLKPVDKSFHQWWDEGDRDPQRINYGIKFAHNNITGRNDKLKLSFMNGYTRQVSLQYYGLWLDPALKWSTNAGFSYGKNREVNYTTINNKQIPFKSDNDFLHTYFGAFLQVNYRPAIKTTHTFGIGYTYSELADTVSKLNPEFFANRKVEQYPEIFYRLSYFDVDFIPYPTKGFMGEFTLKRRGIRSPVNLWELTAKASQTWPLGKKYFFNLKGVASVKLPFNQPYASQQFIGYDGRYMQGYEYYVIDGVAGGYAKASLSRPVFNTHISIPSQRIKCLNYIPIKLYAKTFVNAGYVYSSASGENILNNKPLYSGGFGLDLITFNDMVIKIEWSFNRLGENGLYLHQRNDY